MAIVSLGANDSGSTSRTVINDNFTDLDTTKADLASPTFTGTPTLPTGTIAVTQSANDNSTKVATTAYVDGAVTNFVEAGTVSTVIPVGTGLLTPTTSSATGTTAKVGQVIVPFKIIVNKISFQAGTVNVAGTYDLSLYSEDGQTRLFSVTTASISSSGSLVTTAVPAVTVLPGIYYILMSANGTADVVSYFYTESGSPYDGASSILGAVSGEPVTRGTLTITAGTPPNTLTPSAITSATASTLICRLDN